MGLPSTTLVRKATELAPTTAETKPPRTPTTPSRYAFLCVAQSTRSVAMTVTRAAIMPYTSVAVARL